MPTKDGLTEGEKALATEVAIHLFKRAACDPLAHDDPRSHFDIYMNDPIASRDQIRELAESCFAAAVLFAWARHRVLDNCPDYRAGK